MSTSVLTPESQHTDTADRAVYDRSERLADGISGIRLMLPWLIGVVPFGIAVGMAARASEVSTEAGLLTGATIYSGSAQLTAIGLLDEGAGVLVVVCSVLVINARLVLYGSSIAPHWKGTGLGYRAIGAYLLVDPSYAVGTHGYSGTTRSIRHPHVHYIAAGVTLWVAWHAAMLAGATLGSGVPAWLPIEHAVTLFILAEIVHAGRTRPGLTAALTAGLVALAGMRLPLHSGLLVAVTVGVGAAIAVERRAR